MTRSIVLVGVSPSGIGMAWLRAVAESAEWTLAALVDVDPENRRRAAESAGLPSARCFATLGAALAAVESDAVAIAVSSPLHAALCAEALAAGRHVVVEKPFTTEFTDARALAALAEERGARLMVSQNYRYMRDLLTLRRALAAGVIGRPEFVSVGFHCLWPPRSYQATMADTMLLEMAIHHFDALRFVLGAEALTAWGRTWRPPLSRYGGDTWVDCRFLFAGGVHVAYQGSLESPGLRSPWQGVWRIVGASGALHLDEYGLGTGVHVSRDPAVIEAVEDPRDHGYTDPGGAVAGSLAEFAAALREGRRPQSDARDNLRTLAMACAVSRASAEGRAVDLEREFFPPLP